MHIAYRVAFIIEIPLHLHDAYLLFINNLVTAAIEQCMRHNSEQPTFISSTL